MVSCRYLEVFTIYKDEFHENSPEYTRGIGHVHEHKINIRDSLTILCYCHYNKGTAECKIYFNANISLHQQQKSPFIVKTVQHWYFATNVQNVRRLQKHKHEDAGATA